MNRFVLLWKCNLSDFLFLTKYLNLCNNRYIQAFSISCLYASTAGNKSALGGSRMSALEIPPTGRDDEIS